MEKEFVKYKEALALKELGFDEPCLGFFRKYIDGEIKLLTTDSRMRCLEAPLYQQAFGWFREKYGVLAWIRRPYEDDYFYEFETIGQKFIEGRVVEGQSGNYKAYEEAEQGCLEHLIEIVKTSCVN